MRLTARLSRASRGGPGGVARGVSIPAPIGGWDAISPISAMPEINAVELVNWFPQPGWVEVRRGYVAHCDTGTGSTVETLMAYQGPTAGSARLFAVSDGTIYNVTTSTPSTSVSGLSNSRWQHVNFSNAAGNFLWCCNGLDDPRYFNGAAWTTTNITGTGVTGVEMIACTVYRNRIWTVLRNSTKAAYLDVDAVDGTANVFDLGPQFSLGGFLMAVGTWSTDTVDGPNEYIAFISSRGEVAIYMIDDPTQASGIHYLGTSRVGPPCGRRCLAKLGSDLAIICIDGILPLSKVLSYDRGKLLEVSISKNIQPVVVEAAQTRKNTFGWQLISYPRSTMTILNVPLTEGTEQEQFVQNSITGAWCRFTGQHANCWEIFDDRAYFGGNDGIVYLADEAGVDETGSLIADMRGAFNYYGSRGRQKRWTMIRPLITTSGEVDPSIALNVDFQEDAALTEAGSFFPASALWDVGIWDVDMWSGERTLSNDWQSISGIGYCASIRMRVEISTGAPVEPITLRINSFDVLLEDGAFL
jgi:hypothetical protein